MPNLMPRYPIYIPSKGRADIPTGTSTAMIFLKDEVPFKLVIEEADYDAYAARFGEQNLLVLPFSNLGQGSIPARNWIKDHSIAAGAKRHWQFDDNIKAFRRAYKHQRIPIRSGVACRIIEDWSDRYTNVAISGFNYQCFVVRQAHPLTVNCHVYSATLVLNDTPFYWRGRYNEDTDLCLQALAAGWCTALISAVMVDKVPTMKLGGGNTATLYQGDGRLKMARALERMWPGVVETKRRFNRPQHVVANSWKRFDTPLIRRTDIEWPTGVDEYGMTLEPVKTVQHPRIQQLLDDYNERHSG